MLVEEGRVQFVRVMEKVPDNDPVSFACAEENTFKVVVDTESH